MSLLTYKQTLEFLANNLNPSSAKIEAEWILSEYLQRSIAEIYLNSSLQLTSIQQKEINKVLQRRLTHEPLQYILGKTNFYGLDIFVGEGVLIPRPETEVLVENALQILTDNQLVLDLCTGSAAIPLALLSKNPSLQITASDLSLEALQYAKKNITHHQAKINLIHSNLFDDIQMQEFHLITANPPYIATSLYKDLPEEVLDFEPELALHSGCDGLGLIRQIVKQAYQYLQQEGNLLLEVCSTHTQEVKELLKQNRYRKVIIINDYTQRPRFLLAKK